MVWKDLSEEISAEEFNETEFLIHKISQVLSLTGINMSEPEKDDSHTAIVFNPHRSQLESQWFQVRGKPRKVIFRLDNFSVSVIKRSYAPLKTLTLDDISYNALIEWWKDSMKQLDRNDSPDKGLHYELPDYGIADSDLIHSPGGKHIDQWLALRSNAMQVLEQVKTELGSESDILTWPHHFDTALYHSIGQEAEKDIGIGAGLAIADQMVEEAYFYIYGTGEKLQDNLSSAPQPGKGRWIDNNWKGAVLPYSDITGSTDQQASVRDFYDRAISWYSAQG